VLNKRPDRGGIDRRRIVGAFGVGGAFAALMGALRPGSAATAQRAEEGIVGTWIGEVVRGQRAGVPIRFMLFFFREGIVQYFDAPQVPTNSQTDDPATLEYQSVNAGGQWVQTGVNSYAAYTVGLDYDARGNPTTQDITRITINYDRLTDTLSIINEFRELDASGTEDAMRLRDRRCSSLTWTPASGCPRWSAERQRSLRVR
jgi:hypothetical protein